jgi:hypothetical protein
VELQLTDSKEINDLGFSILKRLMTTFEKKVKGRKFNEAEALTLVAGLSMSFTNSLIFHSLQNHPIMDDFKNYRQFLTKAFNHAMDNLERDIAKRKSQGAH